ncbi:MAG TPA: hypothetical protein DCE03_06075 [Synergistaceae bacterium]|nr:hypothetical protein [Synergistaceae bacterium]
MVILWDPRLAYICKVAVSLKTVPAASSHRKPDFCANMVASLKTWPVILFFAKTGERKSEPFVRSIHGDIEVIVYPR